MARKRGVDRAKAAVGDHPATVTIQSLAGIVGGVLAVLTLASLLKRKRGRR